MYDGIVKKYTPVLAEQSLRKKFTEEVRVVDWEKGYLALPWVNEVIDPKSQRLAAIVIAHLLQKQLSDRQVTKVVGVPMMGTFLSVMLAEELNVPLVTTRKGKHIPTRWEQAVVLEDNMKQYKNGAISSHIYNGLYPGDVAYVAVFIPPRLKTNFLNPEKYGNTPIITVLEEQQRLNVINAKIFQ